VNLVFTSGVIAPAPTVESVQFPNKLFRPAYTLDAVEPFAKDHILLLGTVLKYIPAVTLLNPMFPPSPLLHK